MSILLIDDDKNLCKVLAYQLEKNDFEVVTANSGENGLKEFDKKSFDIVITDIRMPGLSGLELLKQVRRKNLQVIVIIITAHGSMSSWSR